MDPIFIKIRGGKITSIKGYDKGDLNFEFPLTIKRGLIEIHEELDSSQLVSLIKTIDPLGSSLGERDLYFLVENYDSPIRIYLVLTPKKTVVLMPFNIINKELVSTLSSVIQKTKKDQTLKVGADTANTLKLISEKCLNSEIKEVILNTHYTDLCRYANTWKRIRVLHNRGTTLLKLNFEAKSLYLYFSDYTKIGVILDSILNLKHEKIVEISVIFDFPETQYSDFIRLLDTILTKIRDTKHTVESLRISKEKLFMYTENNSIQILGNLFDLDFNKLNEYLNLFNAGKTIKIDTNKNISLIYGDHH